MAIASKVQSHIQDIHRAQARGDLPKSAPINKRAWETAQGLEANFFQTMLGSMFEGVEGEGPMGGSDNASQTWRGMLVEQYAGAMSKAGGIGLTTQIYRDMLRIKERPSHAYSPSGQPRS